MCMAYYITFQMIDALICEHCLVNARVHRNALTYALLYHCYGTEDLELTYLID